MEQLAKITGSICMLIMSMGILNKLGAFPATEKIIRFVISICIITSFVKSFKGADFEVELKYSADNSIQTKNAAVLKNEIIDKTQQELELFIKKRLDEKNIAYNSVSVHILEQNGSISVDEIYIDCNKKYKEYVIECVQDIVSEGTLILTGV